MLFLVYSSLNSRNIESSLGVADYSYYFVMQRFIPLLQEFGEVVVLEKPLTDAVVQVHQGRDICIYLSFTPPDKMADISLCPAIPVFAWEFSTIPYEEFTCPEDNWVRLLQKTGRAITHSSYAADVVKAQLGVDYPVVSVPAPLWDSCEPVREARKGSWPPGLDGLDLHCTEIDSAHYDISNTSVKPRAGGQEDSTKFRLPAWDGQPLEILFGGGDYEVTLIGFNEPEPWGVWSRSGYPWIMLDQAISGWIELEITVRGYAQNVGELLRLEMGTGSDCLILSDHLEEHVLRMHVDKPCSFLAFFGLDKRAIDMDDPRDIGLGMSQLRIRRLQQETDLEQPQILDFSKDGLSLEGFHPAEPVGRWTNSPRCVIRLPHCVSGNVKVKIELFHMLHNDGRVIDFWLGSHCHKLVLIKGTVTYKFSIRNVSGASYIFLDNLGLGSSGMPEDSRLLGLGIASMTLASTAASKVKSGWLQALEKFRAKRSPAPRDNILYTSIFNPHDGRKNWEDIVTAFVYAFRENPDVTLLIKITNNDLSMFFEDIFSFFVELHPFKCRLVFIHGYLHYEEYEQLLIHSHFIVNASRGEGQCLPLMEFMSSGVPAIAPANTAMLDYVDEKCAFIVESSLEITFWPQDPRQVFRTHWQRINWQTLHDAFKQSESVARNQPRVYREMAQSAIESMEKYCSMSSARAQLRGFFELVEDKREH